MLAKFVATIVRAATRFAGPVVAVTLVLGVVCGWYTVGHFAMDTNSDNLVAPNTLWRQNEIQYDREFPQQNNLILIVIDGATAERTEQAATALTTALRKEPKYFRNVRRPDSGPYFNRDGLLLLSKPEIHTAMHQLIKAQPFLGGLAADPTLRGVMTTLQTILQGVPSGQTTLAALDKPLVIFNQTFENVLAGKPAFFPWSKLVESSSPGGVPATRAFIEVKPELDFAALMPGKKATNEIRRLAGALRLDAATGVRVRLTGPVPMADEEFATIIQNGALLASLMAAMLLTMLWLALRSKRMILAVLLTMIVGLAVTASIGLLTYGAFNVISVAFIELFVGLGVDFGIQFCVRYRHERRVFGELEPALIAAGHGIGAGLTLAALAAAAGFFSFLPTDYAGVKELGLIAGAGMVVTYVLSITALPALLKILRPRSELAEVGWARLAPIDDFLCRRPKRVLRTALVLLIAGAAVIPFLRFDSNPLDLRSRHTEAVATALDLMKNPHTSPNTINILEPSRAAAVRLADRLGKLPEVSQVLTIDSFLPDDQDAKIAIIKDAANVLGPTLNPVFMPPPPTDAQTVASLEAAASALGAAIPHAKSAKAAQDARTLAATLQRLAAAPPALRNAATKAFIPGLQTLLAQLRLALSPYNIDFAGLPASLKSDWISSTGQYRVQAFPSGDANSDRVLTRFTNAVLKVAPNATGTPIIIKESGKTIVRAFLMAGIYSFVSIAIILLFALRRFGEVLVALAPLVLAGVMTLASCVLVGIPLNFANIIALPLLFGIGVAFDIYFVMAWRSGQRQLLRSPLTRAVVMSAATTATAFGTLSISSHPGTASMGIILMLALAWILVSMLLVLPALLTYVLPHEGLTRPAGTV
ncbi:MAG: MMPL family transporter [Alphaproteobacteria bacterium]|nr:MMPL family transporter [Alphaproteobacteria bacterium]